MALLIMAEGMVATGAISSIAKIFELENKINTYCTFFHHINFCSSVKFSYE